MPPTYEIPSGVADWDSRRLCTDGTCVGVIGPDGRCRVCGAESPVGESGHSSPPARRKEAERTAEPAGSDDEDQAGFDRERRLCTDGSCIGVIGPSGRCKVCGKPYQG